MRYRKIIMTLLLNIVMILHLSINIANAAYYLLDKKGYIYKLDLNEYKVTSSTKLNFIIDINAYPPTRNNVAIDVVNNNIYLENIDSQGMFHYVEAFDLKTFKYIKRIDGIKSGRDINILVNKTKQFVYVNWWDQDMYETNGAQMMSIINSVDLSILREVKGIKRSEHLVVSPNGESIYMAFMDKQVFGFDVINSSDMSIIKHVDLKGILHENVYLSSINIFDSSRYYLLVENRRQSKTEPSNYTFFRYDFEVGNFSEKIVTGTAGDYYLFNNGNIVAYMLKKPIYYLGKFRRYEKTGIIDFYNLDNAAKVKSISFNPKKFNNWLGQTQDGKYLLFYSHDGGSSKAAVHVIDLATYKNVGSIEIGQNAPVFLFYKEEPDEAPAQ